MYLNYASRVNADTKMTKPTPEPQPADGIVGNNPQDAAKPHTVSEKIETARLDEEEGVRLQSPKKRARREPQAVLVEVDLDWDAKPHLSASSLEARDNAEADVAQSRQAFAKPSVREADKQKTSPAMHGGKGSALIQGRASEEIAEGCRRTSLIQAKDRPLSSSGQDEASQESRYPSAAALEEYSPSRHGGESPPRLELGTTEDPTYQVNLPHTLCPGLL